MKDKDITNNGSGGTDREIVGRRISDVSAAAADTTNCNSVMQNSDWHNNGEQQQQHIQRQRQRQRPTINR